MWRPEFTWEARCEVFLLGIVGIAAQLVVGVYVQKSIGWIFWPKMNGRPATSDRDAAVRGTNEYFLDGDLPPPPRCWRFP